MCAYVCVYMYVCVLMYISVCVCIPHRQLSRTEETDSLLRERGEKECLVEPRNKLAQLQRDRKKIVLKKTDTRLQKVKRT